MQKVDIAVVDYGMGNLRSVSKALEHVAGGKPVIVTADPAVVAAAERVVFPGQGAELGRGLFMAEAHGEVAQGHAPMARIHPIGQAATQPPQPLPVRAGAGSSPVAS